VRGLAPVAVACAAWLAASIWPAASIVAAQEPETAVPFLHSSLDTSAAAVGAPLRLKIQPEVPPGWLVAPPSPEIDLDPFSLRRVSLVRSPDGSGEAFVLDLVPLKAGDVEIPPIPLTASDPDGEEVTLTTEALPVQVLSNLPAPGESAGAEEGAPGEEAAPAPADLKPALTAPRDWLPVWIAAGSLVVATILGFLLFRKLRRLRGRRGLGPVRRRPKRKLRPAWEIALEGLDRIAAADHVGKGEIARQYVEVTAVLRQYLEDRYGVPALESTTSDLRAFLDGVALAPEARTQLLALLGEADLVKFAKALPQESAARLLEGRARDFVNQTTPAPAALEKEAA
jgi:hypothetical protein